MVSPAATLLPSTGSAVFSTSTVVGSGQGMSSLCSTSLVGVAGSSVPPVQPSSKRAWFTTLDCLAAVPVFTFTVKRSSVLECAPTDTPVHCT